MWEKRTRLSTISKISEKFYSTTILALFLEWGIWTYENCFYENTVKQWIKLINPGNPNKSWVLVFLPKKEKKKDRKTEFVLCLISLCSLLDESLVAKSCFLSSLSRFAVALNVWTSYKPCFGCMWSSSTLVQVLSQHQNMYFLSRLFWPGTMVMHYFHAMPSKSYLRRLESH